MIVILLGHLTIRFVIRMEDSVGVNQELEEEDAINADLGFLISQVKAAQVMIQLDLQYLPSDK